VAIVVITTCLPINDNRLDAPREDIIGYILGMNDTEWDFVLNAAEEHLLKMDVKHAEFALNCAKWMKHLTSMRAFS
jgi:hypothetical protein